MYLVASDHAQGSYLGAVKASATSIHAAISTSLTNLNIGVGAYKDWGCDAWGFQNNQVCASTWLVCGMLSTH